MSRTMLLALSWGTLSIAGLQSGNLPPQQLPVYGGSTGSAFTRSCGAGKVLTGLRFREGLAVDAVGLLCRPASSSGSLGAETTVGTQVGGGSGRSGSASCGGGAVVTQAAIYHATYVDGIVLFCQGWDVGSRKVVGSLQVVNQNLGGFGVFGATRSLERCEVPTQPVNSIRGRAGSVVDAVGFICDEP